MQEAYPDLKSNQNFLALQDQLEGRRTASTRRGRIITRRSRQYNTTIRTFPDAIGAKDLLRRQAEGAVPGAAGSDKAPSVDFNTTG
jgi:LemA protein